MASIYKRTGDKRWTIAYMDHEGRRRERSSGTTDKRLAERLAASFSDRELERARGLVDPAAERLASERTRPLSEHFADFSAHLETMQRDARHVDATIAYLRRIADALGWLTLASIDADALTSHLSEQAELRGTGARTFNAAVTAWRSFARWCVRANRLSANPLAGVATRSLDGDRRRVRRDLAPDELARIIDAALGSPTVRITKRLRDGQGGWRTVTVRLSYPERAWAYRIAAGTGFRAGEVASLTPRSFDLDGDTPTVTVEAAYSKRKRRDVQPIRADLADLLRPWLASKPADEPVCALPEGKAGMILRADMEAARAAWIAEAATPAERTDREGSDFLRHTDSAGRVADFHGLRVHFISRVVDAGANVKEAMELARHSDPKLTLRTYAKVSMHSLSKVLDGLPPTAPSTGAERMELRATGTDDATARCPQKDQQTGRATVPNGARRCDGQPRPDDAADFDKPLVFAGLCDSVRDGAAGEANAGEGTRTPNLLIRSQPGNTANAGVSGHCPHFGQQSAADSTIPPIADPDLAALVSAWATLPDPIRRAVLALVAAAAKS